MKDTLSCGKCGSRRVVEVKGNSMNQMCKINLSKWGMYHGVLDRYICCQCGYTEEYVQLTKSFNKWAQKKIAEQGGEFEEYV